MARRLLVNSFLTALFASVAVSAAPTTKRNPYGFVLKNPYGDTIFELGNISYLANTKHPKAAVSADSGDVDNISLPVTVIKTNATVISKDILEAVVASYSKGDDVFNQGFLSGLYISSSANALLDTSAVDYLTSLDSSFIFTGENVVAAGSLLTIAFRAPVELPEGPYLASIENGSVTFSTVYRLYPDTYRTFLFGTYDANDGQDNHNPLGVFLPKFWDNMIPVPSRIYSWSDTRPLAGSRVAIKDLYDIKGLQTSGGSQAWAYITPTANGTAPSVQKILDLGGVLVGKQKLAQFAAGANPWEWQDEQYPFNPRGDGWLTCSASSSGGGCSIAAYDWLDYAIGTDTGSSVRRPAAVAGIYGQRPSQGIMDLSGVMPLGPACDTAGFFSRDPYKWVKFAKAWYAPNLHQDVSVTGLSPLHVPDTEAWPKTILYPTDYLPLSNSAAQSILDAFIFNLTTVFNMTVKTVNFTATVQNSSDPTASNVTALASVNDVINYWGQWSAVGEPLTTAWAALFDGRFPPIDSARRADMHSFDPNTTNQAAYDAALVTKNKGVEWYEREFQYNTSTSCSESLFLYDIGTGGKPSFRERELNDSPAASYLAVLPPRAAITGANICPIFGCADFTVPIGQVSYFSNVTFKEEMMPVTVSMIVKRGCDFMLYNMVEKLADAGVLKTVKTGRTAF